MNVSESVNFLWKNNISNNSLAGPLALCLCIQPSLGRRAADYPIRNVMDMPLFHAPYGQVGCPGQAARPVPGTQSLRLSQVFHVVQHAGPCYETVFISMPRLRHKCVQLDVFISLCINIDRDTTLL